MKHDPSRASKHSGQPPLTSIMIPKMLAKNVHSNKQSTPSSTAANAHTSLNPPTLLLAPMTSTAISKP
jgi:hypothetical protein